jgi:hypothetical protein
LGDDWNKEVKPGPLEMVLTCAFITRHTGDRVPTAYLEKITTL